MDRWKRHVPMLVLFATLLLLNGCGTIFDMGPRSVTVVTDVPEGVTVEEDVDAYRQEDAGADVAYDGSAASGMEDAPGSGYGDGALSEREAALASDSGYAWYSDDDEEDDDDPLHGDTGGVIAEDAEAIGLMKELYKLDGTTYNDVSIHLDVNFSNMDDCPYVDWNAIASVELGTDGIWIRGMDVSVRSEGFDIRSEIEGWMDRRSGEKTIRTRMFGDWSEWSEDGLGLFDGLTALLDRLCMLGSVENPVMSDTGSSYYKSVEWPVSKREVRSYFALFGNDFSDYKIVDRRAEAGFKADTLELSHIDLFCRFESRDGRESGMADIFVNFRSDPGYEPECPVDDDDGPYGRSGGLDLDGMDARFGKGIGGWVSEMISELRAACAG